MRNLTLEGNIVICKTIGISKIIFQLFITTAPRHFFWKNSTPKIIHEKFVMTIKPKDFPVWKLIPLYLIEKSFGILKLMKASFSRLSIEKSF